MTDHVTPLRPDLFEPGRLTIDALDRDIARLLRHIDWLERLLITALLAIVLLVAWVMELLP